MNLVRRLFPFRTCTIEINEGERALQRPCLLYHIKRCQGPCIEAISKADYRADIEQVELFLEGRQETLARASSRDAGRLRARGLRARGLASRQDPGHRADDGEPEDGRVRRTELDWSGWRARTTRRPMTLFVIRDGKVIGRDVFLLDAAARRPTTKCSRASWSSTTRAPPRSRGRCYVPAGAGRGLDIEAFLDGASSGRPGPPAGAPARGERSSSWQLATRNAAETLAREQARWLADQGKTLAARGAGRGARAARSAAAHRVLRHLELPGRGSVGSMVVFEDGKPRSGEYRRFRIRTVQGPNDFATHQEVLRRRFRRPRAGDEGTEEERRWAMPDLVIIDGGKGQVSAAKAVLDELGLHDLPLAGLAKEREELFLPARRAGRPPADLLCPVPRPAAPRRGPSLRDHVPPLLRDKRTVRSAFDDLPGVGPKRRGPCSKRVRLREARPRGAGRADRRRPRHRRALADRIKASLEACAGARDAGRGASRGSPGAGGLRRWGAVSCIIPPCMRKTGPILILVIGVLALLIDFFPNLRCPTRRRPGVVVETKLGLDLEGGLRVEYQALPGRRRAPRLEVHGVIRDIIENRVNRPGVSEPVVVVQGSDRIVIELPGVSDVDSVRRLVGQTASSTSCPSVRRPDRAGPLGARSIRPCSAATRYSASIGRTRRADTAVTFQLKARRREAVRRLHQLEHVGEYFAVALDDTGDLGPPIDGRDPGGQVQVARAGTIGGFPIKGGQRARHGPQVRLAAVPDQELSSDRCRRRSASSSSTRACWPASSASCWSWLHDHLLPSAGPRGDLRPHLLHGRRLAIFQLVPVT